MQTFAQNAKRPVRSFKEGIRQMSERNEILPVYITIFLGNLTGWVGKLLYALQLTGKWNFGPLGPWEILIQVFFSAVIAIGITTAMWPKLKDVEPEYRWFMAFFAGVTTNIGLEIFLGGGKVAASVL